MQEPGLMQRLEDRLGRAALLDAARAIPATPPPLSLLPAGRPPSALQLGSLLDQLQAIPELEATVQRLAQAYAMDLPPAPDQGGAREHLERIGATWAWALVLPELVLRSLPVQDHERARYRRHALGTALIAQTLAARYAPALRDGWLWSAALLHDVGQLVQRGLDPELGRTLDHRARTQGLTRHEAEAGQGGLRHTELGALLCWSWGLPAAISECCLDHELDGSPTDREASREQRRRHLVAAASSLADLTWSPLGPASRRRLAAALRQSLGLSEGELVELLGAVHDLELDLRGMLEALP